MIAADSYLKAAARNVDVEVVRSTAILRGTVPSEYDKQELAGRIAQIPGVIAVDNRLVVGLK
jgi:osmotically-inducible protein OsmY